MIIDFTATNFGLAITHDFDDQFCTLSTICPRKIDRYKQGASLV
jgi:hypothetical protein